MTCESCDDAAFTLEIIRGKTNRQSFGAADSENVYKQINSATQAAPCVISVPAHGMPDDWVFSIEGAKGMRALNRVGAQGRVIDAHHIELNDFNALNEPAYTGGGVIVYAHPRDLTGYTARGKIRRSYGDSDGVLDLSLTVDISACAVNLEISEDDALSLQISAGVFDIELVNGPEVEELIRGKVTVLDESTDG